MALPWLESLSGFGAASPRSPRRDRTVAAAPKRFAVLFMGNGINANHWWAKGAGAEMELRQDPRSRWSRSRRRSTSSTACSTSPRPAWASIPGMTGNMLSGVPLQKGAIIHGGISMDQVLANHLGQDDAAAQHGARPASSR